MSATLVVVTSDQHCGSSVALCPPKIELDDGGEYVALQFPIEHFVYDTRSHGDVLRLRDAISECIKKGLEPGQGDV